MIMDRNYKYSAFTEIILILASRGATEKEFTAWDIKNSLMNLIQVNVCLGRKTAM